MCRNGLDADMAGMIHDLANPSTPETSELSGNLKGLPFNDLVQVLCMARKTGTLALRGQNEAAKLLFSEGDVRHAQAGTVTGFEAFRQMAGWKDAQFTFATGPVPGPVTINQPTMTLLLDCARGVDEQDRNPGQ